MVPIKSGVNAKAKTRTKRIQWNKAITHDNGRVIEVVIEYNFHGFPVKGEKFSEQVMEKQKLPFFRLILEKNEQGGYKKYLMKYFPSQRFENQSKLNVNNNKTLSERFSEEVLQYDWDEKRVKGWEISDGQIIRFFRSREERKGKNGQKLAQQCKNYTELICESYPLDGGEKLLECTDSLVVECPSDEGGAGWYVSPPGYSGPETGSVSVGTTGPGNGGGGGSENGSGGGNTGEPTLLPDDEQAWQDYIDEINDPSAKREAQLNYLLNHGGSGFVDMIDELMAVSGLTMRFYP